jgi:hypothetical protein
MSVTLNPSRLHISLYKFGCASPTHPHANSASKPNPSCHPSSSTVAIALSSPPPLFWRPTKLSHVTVVRSQKPNPRRKNLVKCRYVASAIYRWSLAIIFSSMLQLFQWTWRQSDITGEIPLPYSRSWTLHGWNWRSITEVIANSDELPAKFCQANSIFIFYLQLRPDFTYRSLHSFYLIAD